MQTTPHELSGLASRQTYRRIRGALLFAVVAGIVAALVTLLPNTRNALDTPISNEPAQIVPKEKAVPPDPEAKRIARKFIETAVLRKNLDWAYDHVSADLKGRMTRTEWDAGTVPVIPFPAENVATTAFVTDYSYTTEVLFEVNLVARPGTTSRPSMYFFLGMKRAGGKPDGAWLVSYWEPHWRPPVPYAGR